MKRISIVCPCYNEEGNVEQLYQRVKKVMESLSKYDFEMVFIDNHSSDKTVENLRRICLQDPRVRVIVNVRNFGHIRSPYHAIFQTRGDAVITMCSDLQDPPELLTQFIQFWEQGYKVVMGQKSQSQESPVFYFLRTLYYRGLKLFSDVDLVEHYTGFGLYDREVIEEMRKLDDPYPYFRGLISELGYERAIVQYNQPQRIRGITKNNFFTLYDMAMLGLTSHSRVPLRMATLLGFVSALASFVIALIYFVYKLLNWQNFSVGIAPLVVGIFFFSSVQLIFLGIVGEYVGAIYTQILKRPLVVEKERINFEE